MGSGLEQLAPPTRWIGRRLDVYREVDSTNLLAEALARAGAPEGTLVVADRQTAGRGRLGRSFFSPGGVSLYLSLVLRPSGSLEALPQIIFAAAVAVADAAKSVLPDPAELEIKWPNDVLVGGRKLSGINLPAETQASGIAFAVLGIGINVNTQPDEFPAGLRTIATSLRIHCGYPLDRVAFAHVLLVALESELDRLRREGFAPVLERWRESFRMVGSRVSVGGPGVRREVSGVIAGVDPAGALLLETREGSERILAGDITVLERSTNRRDGGA